MEFEEYLKLKKINGAEFSQNDPVRYKEFKTVFEQMHPNSFTAQKLFLINEIRRKFPIGHVANELHESQPTRRARPKMIIPKKN